MQSGQRESKACMAATKSRCAYHSIKQFRIMDCKVSMHVMLLEEAQGQVLQECSAIVLHAFKARKLDAHDKV